MTRLSKVIIGTGNYREVETGNTLSISGDGGNSAYYYGHAYKKLAPRLEQTYLPYKETLEILNDLRSELLFIKDYKDLKNKVEDEYDKTSYKNRIDELGIYELLNNLYNKYGNNPELIANELIRTIRFKIEDNYINSFYDTRLKELDVKKLLNELYDSYGYEIILLCYELAGEFCHRRLVADYIELTTGIYIPEIRKDSDGNITKLSHISYKGKLGTLMKK